MPDNLEGESLTLLSLNPGDIFTLTNNTSAERAFTFVVNPLSSEEELVPLDGEFTVHPQTPLLMLYPIGSNLALIRDGHMAYILSSGVGVEKVV